MGFFRRHGEEDTSSGPEVRVEILGKPTVLKDADCWLRALQRVAAEDSSLVFHGGFYCWNNRCKRCFLSIEPGGEAASERGVTRGSGVSAEAGISVHAPFPTPLHEPARHLA